MISFTCPGCQSSFKLADELGGKTARCSKCSQRFTVPAGQAAAHAPVLAAQRKVALKPMPAILEAEVVEEVEEVEVVEAPRARAAANAKPLDDVEVVEEAIQEPRPGRRAAEPASRDDDRPRRRRLSDDDDDDDLPRRKRRRKQSSNTGWIIAGIGGGVAVLAVVIVLVVWLVSRRAPVAQNAPPQMPVNNNPNQPQQNPPPEQKGGAPNVPGAQNIQLVNGRYQTQDRISLNDPQDPRRAGFHAKRYAVNLEAGKSYSIEMDAVGAGALFFDPYLRVESQAGNFANEDDDSGVGELDARIVFIAPNTGTYIITATTFAPRMQGNYRLTIRTPP